MVSKEEMQSNVVEAQRMAEELNALFEGTPIRRLLQEDKVRFAYHPSVIDGGLGEAYRKGTIEWAQHGALAALLNLLDKERSENIPKFGAGMFGSVWFDVELTGGRGQDCRTKLVRVCPMEREGDRWTLMLDNTFDEAW